MSEAVIFDEDDRVELVDGEVMEMVPMGNRHVESVMRLTRLLSRWAYDTVEVSVHDPLAPDEYGEPQLDLALRRKFCWL